MDDRMAGPMRIARGGWTWILGTAGIPAGVAVLAGVAGWSGAVVWTAAGLAAVGGGFMLFFFRDPDRTPPPDPRTVVAGADGIVRAVEEMPEHQYLQADTVRISTFLSPFNVHVNRSPLAGTVIGLDYSPGKHLLTIRNAASEYNEHSSILIQGETTRCLVKQIVGPVVRRVVYWLTLDQTLARGERIGMMKFGSRLDVYLPRSNVTVLVRKGDAVRAGITPIATLNKE
jgi:phosphatidylserine decarboxylase